MKNILVIALAIFSLASCNTKKKNDLQKENLHGKVKFVRETLNLATEEFGKVVKDSEGKRISGMKYNEEGNMILFVEYDWNGKIESENKIEKDDNDNSTYCKYDRKGNLIEENEYHSDGSLYGKITYKNDKQGNPIEKNEYYDGFWHKYTYKYKYDKQGNPIEIYTYYSNSKSRKHTYYSKCIYKYDEKGNVIEENNSNNNEFPTKYIYKYDEKGNWIQRIADYGNSNIEVIEREIEYYP